MHKQQGFSLIELIIAIVVLGFVLSAMVKSFMDLSVMRVGPEYRHTQTMVGQELMEEIKSKRFDELSFKDANDNWSWTLGTDSGEVSTDKSTFDDVDDFDGWNEAMSTPYSGFTRTVDVSYVSQADLNTPLAIPGSVTSSWTPEYKRIQITVSNNAVADLVIVSIVSSARSRTKSY